MMNMMRLRYRHIGKGWLNPEVSAEKVSPMVEMNRSQVIKMDIGKAYAAGFHDGAEEKSKEEELKNKEEFEKFLRKDQESDHGHDH